VAVGLDIWALRPCAHALRRRRALAVNVRVDQAAWQTELENINHATCARASTPLPGRRPARYNNDDRFLRIARNHDSLLESSSVTAS
jgi:hypothetical protein